MRTESALQILSTLSMAAPPIEPLRIDSSVVYGIEICCENALSVYPWDLMSDLM